MRHARSKILGGLAAVVLALTAVVAVPFASGASAATRAAAPDLSGFPTASSTGVQRTHLVKVPSQKSSGPGWSYDTRGWVTITGAGTDFSGFDVSVPVWVLAPNVTIRQNYLAAADDVGIVQLRGNSPNAVIKRNTFSAPQCTVASPCNPGSTDPAAPEQTSGYCTACDDAHYAIYGLHDISDQATNPTVYADKFVHEDHPIQLDDGLVENDYVAQMTTDTHYGGHVDDFFSIGGVTRQLTIKHDTLLNDFTGDGSTASIFLNNYYGQQTNRIITDNLIAGGGYTIYGGDSCPSEPDSNDPCAGNGIPRPSNETITGNVFSTAYAANSGYYAACTAMPVNGERGNTLGGNVYADGPRAGQLIAGCN